MASHGPLLQFALLAGFVLAITLSLLIAAGERPLRHLLSSRAPAQRARIFWWMLVTPALAGIGYAATTIAMPSVSHGADLLAAACSAHADALWHLCVWHPSDSGQSAGLWIALALLAGYAAYLGVRAAAGLWRGRQILATMMRLSRRPEHSERLHVLEVAQPLAMACGIGRGHVLLSTSLLEQLNPTQLRVVLAHEQAHVAHRDVLYRLIAAVFSSIQLPGVRRRLLSDLELALEQRCDFSAAAAVGCPIVVAEVIVAVENIFKHHAKAHVPLSMAFFSEFVAERVEALLSPQRRAVSYVGALLSGSVLAFCSLSTGWLHLLTESLIRMLTR